MKLEFTKMHGLGNDFVLIDCREKPFGDRLPAMADLSRRLCHRRFGVGADQVLLLYPSDVADCRMKIFNADGSEVEMCGNGIRCLARYIWDRKISEGDALSVETAAGIMRPERRGELVRVDMGEPVLEGRRIPVKIDGEVKDYPLKIDDREFRITCVSMGNPHAVIFVNDVGSFEVGRYGPLIERHELFPNRVNVEFIQVLGPDSLKMRVWERGSGETMACGTGASAAAVAAHLNRYIGKKSTVALLGGDLEIEWAGDNHVYMTGPAEEVFEGRMEI
ncbi:MAG: diaminopimelate epimerase [Nitrospiraceae bacterium]|nr:diaminopimelate epimerase [Nitrospiraceae bacterium]